MSREKTVYFYPEYYAEIIGKKIEILPPFLNPHQCPHKKPQRLYKEFIKVNTNSLQDIVNFMNKYNFFYVPKKLIKKEWLKLADTVIGEDICINAKIFKKLQEEFINFTKKRELAIRDKDFISQRASEDKYSKQYIYSVYISCFPTHKKKIEKMLREIKRLELEDFFNQVINLGKISKSKEEWISEKLQEIEKFDISTLYLQNEWFDKKLDPNLEKSLSKESKERNKIIEDLKKEGYIKSSDKKIETPASTYCLMYNELFYDVGKKPDNIRKKEKRANPTYRSIENRSKTLKRAIREYPNEPIFKLLLWLNKNYNLIQGNNSNEYLFQCEKSSLIKQDFKHNNNMNLLERARVEGWLEYIDKGNIVKYNLAYIRNYKPQRIE